MDTFFEDPDNGLTISWSKLIEDIHNFHEYNPYCNPNDYYQVFKQIIFSLLTDKEIVLLDSDFSDSELMKLTGYSDFYKFTQPIKKDEFKLPDNKEELIDKLNNTSKEWGITLFTSGTTGIPKKVTHNFKSITRFVKISDNNKNNVWGFAYNPTHMAGIQVFFQALLNGNTITRLFGLNTEIIKNVIRNNGITHISATPTFYRLLLPCDNKFPSVERITSGGEKFNEQTIKQLKSIFPNAKITNVYASTEAGTLFASENDIFEIKLKYKPFVRIQNNELMIHASLMGNTGFNVDEWYNTGDLVELIKEDPLKFRFISRKSDMINVGGYKVNPMEVEEVILTFSGIKNVRVYGKNNSVLGNIICCEIVRENGGINERSIRTFLQSKLQEFKIPRFIRFVNELSTTRTGKIKRN